MPMRRMLVLAPIAIILAVACGCSKSPGLRPVSIRPAPGTFELCILANPTDDSEAFDRATEFFAAARSDPKLTDVLRQRAEANEPPPAPESHDGPEFVVGNEVYTYRWAPVSDAMLRSNLLEPVPSPGTSGEVFYKGLKEAR